MNELPSKLALLCFGALIACGFSACAAQTASGKAPPAEMPAGPCQSDMTWDADMGMCMPGTAKPKSTITFHLNQFMLNSSTSGPRGQSRLTGPGMWMLTYDSPLTPKNSLSIDVMGSAEQWSVGDSGTPQLLQIEKIDAMHAHDTIMALEFRDIVALEPDNQRNLTFLFAPRGEAAIGPVPFMHRDSAEGNPDAPLGHALQDGFHDVSTVLGAAIQIAHTTVEATAFSGRDISWPIPLHQMDSYGLRLNHAIDNQVSAGVSYANAKLPNGIGMVEHNRFISGWLTTSHLINGNTLKSTFVWGQARVEHAASLNSFLEEAVYRLGSNKFYGRAEILQILPRQLHLTNFNNDASATWVKAFTVGYERTLFKKENLSLLAGGSYTIDMVPAEFKPSYGSDPQGVKIYLHLKFMADFDPTI